MRQEEDCFQQAGLPCCVRAMYSRGTRIELDLCGSDATEVIDR